MRPTNLRYFVFRSSFRASDIDSRGPTDLFSVDFELKLSENTVADSAPLLSIIAFPTIASPTTITTNNRTVETDKLAALRFELGNLGDDHIATLSADDMKSLLKRSMSVIADTPPASVKKTRQLETNLFGSPTTPSAPSSIPMGTSKMNSVFASTSKRSSVTYTRPLDFLEDHNQSVFTTIFG